ncbi:hypothetical protein [Brucella sp. 10RB9213]|uniref:hypothetical protein n=1 Tax=Brucella sp. 10RB9213 TaxID=1844039 RepID=UPI0019D56C3F|nr:hypothetical protein [Brucella sp. 10RB9213]
MTTIPEEAVTAALAKWMELPSTGDTSSLKRDMRAALTAAIPFLPVQGASAARELALEEVKLERCIERWRGMKPSEVMKGSTAQITYALEDARKDILSLARALSSPDHADDLAVDRFAIAMKQKLAKKREEGRSGWENKDECSAEYLSYLLIQHIWKGDPVDIANLAMMLQQRGERVVIDSETSSIIPHHAAAGKAEGDGLRDDVAKVYVWLREPDWNEEWDLCGWLNRRPSPNSFALIHEQWERSPPPAPSLEGGE